MSTSYESSGAHDLLPPLAKESVMSLQSVKRLSPDHEGKPLKHLRSRSAPETAAGSSTGTYKLPVLEQSAGKDCHLTPEIGEGNPFVEGHIPVSELKQWSAKTVRILSKADGKEKRTGRRILRIVFIRCYSPITDLKRFNFVKIFYDTFNCHFYLWQGGLHHRDIGVHNLMWHRDANNAVSGVLLDFDFSSFDDVDPRANERIGTLPFMALDLLTARAWSGDVARIYAQDAESFFWVALWVTSGYEERAMVDEPSALCNLLRGIDHATCRSRKAEAMLCGGQLYTRDHIILGPWVHEMNAPFEARAKALRLEWQKEHCARLRGPAIRRLESLMTNMVVVRRTEFRQWPEEVVRPPEPEQFCAVRLRPQKTGACLERPYSDDVYARNEELYRTLVPVDKWALNQVNKGMVGMEKATQDASVAKETLW